MPPRDRAADGIGGVDARALTLLRILRGPSDPEQTSVSRDGTHLYVANEDAGKASVLEIEGGRTLAELDVGGEPEGVTISPDGRFVYVTSEEDSLVSVIDTAANKVIKQFTVGARPRDSAFAPDGSRAYVTGENDGTVTVVDTWSHTVVETIQLTGENIRPMGLVVSPDGQRIYVTTGRGEPSSRSTPRRTRPPVPLPSGPARGASPSVRTGRGSIRPTALPTMSPSWTPQRSRS